MFVWDFLFLFPISVSLTLFFSLSFFLFFFFNFYILFNLLQSRTVESWTKYSQFLEQAFPCSSFPIALGNHLKSSTACELGALGWIWKILPPPACVSTLLRCSLLNCSFFLSSSFTSYWTLWTVLLSDQIIAVHGPLLCVREHWKGVGTVPLPGAGRDFTFLACPLFVSCLDEAEEQAGSRISFHCHLWERVMAVLVLPVGAQRKMCKNWSSPHFCQLWPFHS